MAKPYLRRVDYFNSTSVAYFERFDHAGKKTHMRRFGELSHQSLARLCEVVNRVRELSGGNIFLAVDGWSFTQYKLEGEA